MKPGFRKKPFENRSERPSRERRDERPREFQREEPPRPSTIFGVNPVLELLRSGSHRVERILIVEGTREHRLAEINELARSQSVIVDRVERSKLERLTGNDVNHQGVAALISAADYADANEILSAANANSLLLVLDGIEDPRNLGAILRTAECAGVGGVFIPERRAVGLTDTVAKSSAGAVEHIKVAKVANLNRLIEDLKKKNIWVVGTSVDATMDHTEWDWRQASALVLGGEGSGLHRLVAENCDVLVKIPMYGKIDSLNVSVAAGVVLFEARRQRG